MQHQFKKNNFFIYYIVLTAVSFIYTIYNLIRIFIYNDFTVTELFSSLGRTIPYYIPLVAFIFISKKTAVIEDVEKRIKIKKYVMIYLIASFVFGFMHYLFYRFGHWKVPIFPSCLFYSSGILFYLEVIIKSHLYGLFLDMILDISFWIISLLFVKSLSKEIPPEEEFKG